MTEKREPYVVDRPKSVQVFSLLSQPMPQEALKTDDSRGFPLTSIKAAFILERLNETFGLLGYGWRYAHSPHHVENAGGKEEVLVEVAFQWRMLDMAADGDACPSIHWRPRSISTDGDIVAAGWVFAPERPAIWSEPIFTTGGSGLQNRTGSVPFKDCCQGATTNGITKAASRLGVGLEVFKGQNDAAKSPPRRRRKERAPAAPKAAKAPAATKAPATDKDSGIFLTLTGIQQAAQAEVDRLKVEDGKATEGTIQVLAHQMETLGLHMQPARLLQALFGETAEFSQKYVMGTYNFLRSAGLTQENIDTIHAGAWAGSQQPAEE